MSNKTSTTSTGYSNLEGKSQDEILVDMNGKQVPLSKISKPHAVVLPQDHQGNLDAKSFPGVEPEAQQKEDIKAFDQAILEPGKHGQKFDAASFPPVEPEAQKREEELEAARRKEN
ncbi:hypothetical protein KGF56_004772 [Candida oxycetoniae]|uniref:Uncharacterized protein n=1 Tax=Candida oxycetoniae TaxID=497107 RepID=A0AAI9ST07_9ASCO|nr:uncharacterized protein KGF56_004772 [Candida oxycetoniae]KAI3402364.1 hypothetical protein KGF56_004772 [Candida oxycetoniae]